MSETGRKRTLAGQIPEDWDTVTVGEIAAISTGSRDTQDKDDDGRYPFFVRSNNVERINTYSFDGEAVLTAGDGAGTGKVFHYIDGKFDYHQRVYKIGDFDPDVDGIYFFHQFRSRFYDRVMSMTAKSSVDSVRMEIIANMMIPLPSFVEQRHIAAALSDVGALIAKLDAIISKKRVVKTAATQRLLSGEQRLPGFDGAWETRRLGDIGTFAKGKGIRKSDLTTEGIPCVRYGELYTRHSHVIRHCVSFIPTHVTEHAREIRKGDILFAGSGETKEEIGKCAAYMGEGPAYAGGDIVILTPHSEDPTFLGYAFNTPRAADQKSSMAQGDAVVHLYARHLAELKVELPPLEEQRAIARVLSHMDAEIEALEARRDKTQPIKQGMMQELLSGRTRLIDRDQIETQGEREQGSRKGHSWAFDQAVLLAVVSKHFGSEEYPLGRKRRTKLLYLLHRRTENAEAAYEKKAAGPYSPKIRYGGPERIAKEKEYVELAKAGKYRGFIAGEKIAEAEAYFAKWYGKNLLGWLEQFRYYSNDDLELLTTVDMAVRELREDGCQASVANVKRVLSDDAEWRPKLERKVFSDINIKRAIDQSEALFGRG